MDYILEQKVESGDLLYLVKWSYKSHTENTWLKESQIVEKGNKQLIEEFINNCEKVSNSENISKSSGNDLPKKKLIQKRHRKGKVSFIKMNSLQLKMPVKSNIKNHWIFGHRIQQILRRNDELGKYEIEWQNGGKQWEDEATLLKWQPQKLCLFMQKELAKLAP